MSPEFARDAVVAGAAEDGVGAGGPDQQVDAAEAGDAVGAAGAEQQVVLGGAGQAVGVAAAVNDGAVDRLARVIRHLAGHPVDPVAAEEVVRGDPGRRRVLHLQVEELVDDVVDLVDKVVEHAVRGVDCVLDRVDEVVDRVVKRDGGQGWRGCRHGDSP